MAWQAGLPLDNTKVRLIPDIIRQNNAAIQGVLTASNLLGPIPYIPNSHPMYFYADTAPAGWTIVAAPADCLLALKGGASQYNVAGGALVGTWVGAPHALIQGEVPKDAIGPSPSYRAFPFGTPANPHSHDWTTTRPRAALGVLATKNP